MDIARNSERQKARTASRSGLSWVVVGLLLAFVVVASGCATKKHVRAQVEPLEKSVSALESTTQQQGTQIGQLQTGLSAANERATAAGAAAKVADGKAVKAGEAAVLADQHAGEAAEEARNALKQGEALGMRLDSLDNYQEAGGATVQFTLASATLSDEGKQSLAGLAAKIPAKGPFAIEVKGYTDTTGSASTNLSLSGRRADAVVSYLAGEHDVPLHRIYKAGLGSVNPTAENDTRSGREMNRRVEVTLYVAGQ